MRLIKTISPETQFLVGVLNHLLQKYSQSPDNKIIILNRASDALNAGVSSAKILAFSIRDIGFLVNHH